uniref:Glucagon / GIP / secretin / VIP family domain-containing protein n=1 Tax=Neogobius melanostomus TaxID=47308 RepID=A0A8C6WT44_9GOBI
MKMNLVLPRCLMWRLYGIEKGHHFIPNHKRHSDGTYTSDFANNQDTIRAKDFVKWLTNVERERSDKPSVILHS